MVADWKQMEGRVVAEFPLRRFLGGTEHHPVFLVDRSAGGQSRTVVIFMRADSVEAREPLHRWEAAAKLNHPNLLRIFETGRCEIGGSDFIYAWTEYGEEDLSQILPTRALTIPETRQILDAVLPALSYLHGQGLAHGSLKPSNIFAIGETVKISSDSVRPSGKPSVGPRTKSAYDAPEAQQGITPPADVWSLGATLVEAITQRSPVVDSRQPGHLALPEGIPQSFKEIIGNFKKTFLAAAKR